ncbi:unnamed protein product, partial [Mesorhabditis belari]|uniref:Uncharacterized protein n=1 Tax=Mesorhabditis belari TaxID=2138241 RepID=A0AAF3EIW4_9BILA
MTSVHSAGPSMQVYSTEVTSFSLPYAFLFIFGTAGNVAVLTYVFFVTRTGRKRVADTMDELCIEIMSRSEEAPNCVQAQSQTARVWDHGDVALLELETDIDTSDDLGKRVCLEARGLTLKEPMLAFGMGDGKIQKLSSDEQDTFCGRGKATTKANIL